MSDDNWHKDNEDVTGMSNTVVKCCRENIYTLYYMAVYMLSNKFSGYVPLILVKWIFQSICRWEEAEECVTGTTWQLWKSHHVGKWELLPRNDKNREHRQDRYPAIHAKYWNRQ